MTRSVHGFYHGRGWVVEVGDDAADDTVLVASIHEAMHDRLQMTTVYGTLVDLLGDLARREDNADAEARAAILLRSATRVHEQFATWMSAVPVGWGSDQLDVAFPVYARHLARARDRVAALPGAYLAMHAMQAAARVSMQPAGVADLLQRVPVRDIRPGQIGRRDRPDWRLARLDRALAAHGWGPLLRWVGDEVSLEPERFAEDGDPSWDALNQGAYDWCRSLLEQEGCPTLPYDGHLRSVHAQRRLLGLPTGPPGPTPATVALMSVESETLVLRGSLPAVVLPGGTDPSELAAGDAAHRHLFLAIRPRDRVASQYALTGAPLTRSQHVAVLRCMGDDGTVELLDVTAADPAALMDSAPLVVSASMTSLADPEVAKKWSLVLGNMHATVLADQRPSVNLSGWLSDPARSLRYSLFGVESYTGRVTVLAFRIESGGNWSRTYLAPVSRLYASGLRLMLTETPVLAGRVHLDDSLGDNPLVRAAVAHILLEERTFDFKAGDSHA